MSASPRGGFVAGVGPLRALAEGVALGGLAFVGLLLLMGSLPAQLLPQGALAITLGTALWCALRLRPSVPLLRPLTWLGEGLLACAFGLAVSLLWGLAARLLTMTPAVVEASHRGAVFAVLLPATGLEFLALRVGLALWRAWMRLTRQHLHWAIAHTHAQLVLLLAVLGAAATAVTLWAQGHLALEPSDGGVLVSTVSRLLWTVFPWLGIIAVLTVAALAVLALPASVLSYRMARRTTRRLQGLVAAAEALRQGDHDARAVVEGEDEVARLQAHFNAMAGDLQGALEGLASERDRVATLLDQRRELIANVSHELRTPVAILRGHVETHLKADPAEWPEGLRRDLAVMEDELLRLQRLIDDLFALSQAEAGGLGLRLAPTDVGGLVQGCVEAMAPLAWQGGRVELLADIPAERLMAQADAQRLQQVVANLLRNALRHTPPGGIISARVCAVGGDVAIEVRDTGQGIPPEELPHVWQRFFRGEGVRDRDSGAGLGLALVRELSEGMGGCVSVESRPDEGSCFTVRLPRAAEG